MPGRGLAPSAGQTDRKAAAVVVGIDESDRSDHALAEAFDIARTLRAPLTVVHMWEIGAAVGMGDLGGQGNMDWPLLKMLGPDSANGWTSWSHRWPPSTRTLM